MTMRSAEDCEMSRSCQSGTFSRPTSALPRRTRASPQMRSATFGFRLCGIAEEPFIPLPNGSSTSRTSVRARWRISVANRSSDVAASASAPRAVRRDDRGRSPGSRPGRAPVPVVRRRCVRPRGRPGRTSRPSRRAARRDSSRVRARRGCASRSSSNAQPASFQPNVVGSAWTPCERPMQIVCRCSLRPRDDSRERAVDPFEDQAPGVLNLQRQRGVDDVGRGEAVVEPAAFGPELLRDGVDEGRRVVVRHPLDLGDALAVTAGGPARGSRRRRSPECCRARPTRRAPRAPPRATARTCSPPTRSRSFPGGSSARSLGRF